MKLLPPLIALVFGLSLAAPTAQSVTPANCDLNLNGRANIVADYVDDARVCLQRLPVGYRFDRDAERQFIALINKERSKRGLSILRTRLDLIDSARFHSLDMGANNFFAHTSPDGRTVAHRVAAFDRRGLMTFTAENLAMLEVVQGPFDIDKKAVPRLHQNLMDSPGHRKNILSDEITDIAVGVVATDTGIWVTQVFVDLTGTLSRPVPVRMKVGQRIAARADLRGWSFKRFEAEGSTGAFSPILGKPQSFSQSNAGDIKLAAYSERPGDTPRQTYTIRLAGPAITVER